jgi:hypothetical protein
MALTQKLAIKLTHVYCMNLLALKMDEERIGKQKHIRLKANEVLTKRNLYKNLEL